MIIEEQLICSHYLEDKLKTKLNINRKKTNTLTKIFHINIEINRIDKHIPLTTTVETDRLPIMNLDN